MAFQVNWTGRPFVAQSTVVVALFRSQMWTLSSIRSRTLTFEPVVGKHGVVPTIVVARRAIITAHCGTTHSLDAQALPAHYRRVHALSINLRPHRSTRVIVIHGIAVHATCIYGSVIHVLITHMAVVDCIAVHPVIEAGTHWAHVGRATKLRTVILFTHAVNLGPEALFQPADLAKNLVAALHLFFTVTRCGSIGKLVDERTCGVYELVECR